MQSSNHTLATKQKILIAIIATSSAYLFAEGTDKPTQRYIDLLSPANTWYNEAVMTIFKYPIIPIGAWVTNGFFNFSAYKDFYLHWRQSSNSSCHLSSFIKLLTGLAGVLPFWWMGFNQEKTLKQLLSTLSALLNVPINMVGLDHFKDTLKDLEYLTTINHHSSCTYLSYALFITLSLCLNFQNIGFCYESYIAIEKIASLISDFIAYPLMFIGLSAHALPGLGYTLKGCVTIKKYLDQSAQANSTLCQKIITALVLFCALFSGFLGDQASYACFTEIWLPIAFVAGIMGNIGTVAYNAAEALGALSHEPPPQEHYTPMPNQPIEILSASLNSPAPTSNS